MKNERNICCCTGATPGFSQMPGMPWMGQIPGMGLMPGMPGVNIGQGVDQIEQRLANIENQIRRLDIRVSRLETPYADQTPFTDNTWQYPTQPTQSIQGI
jgi:hypothetical protein